MTEKTEKITILGSFIWLVATLFFLYEFFLRTFVGTLAYQIISELHLSLEEFSLLGTAYFISYSLMQIPVGILCEKFGVKKIAVIAAFICALSIFLFANSTTFEMAFFSRLIMGFGSSFAFICLLVVTLDCFPRKYFGFFAGATQLIGTAGPLLAAGPLMSFMVNMNESWRGMGFQVGYVGIVIAILMIFFLKKRPLQKEKKVVFLKKNTEPIKKQVKNLLKNRQALFIAFYSAFVYVSIVIFAAVWGTDYLQVLGFSQTNAAYLISIAWIGYAFGCPFLGFVSDTMRRRKPVLILASVLGFISILFIIFSSLSFWIFAISFFSLGIAAAGQSVGFVIISEHVRESMRSTAFLNNTVIMLFSATIPLFLWLDFRGCIKKT